MITTCDASPEDAGSIVHRNHLSGLNIYYQTKENHSPILQFLLFLSVKDKERNEAASCD